VKVLNREDVMPSSVHVETPDLNSASNLRHQLLDFDSSLAPLPKGRWKVSAEVFSEGSNAKLEVDRILGLVHGWLDAQELTSTTVQLGDKTYLMLP
jgi:hypothetical protein